MKKVKTLYCTNPGEMFDIEFRHVIYIEEFWKKGLFSKNLWYKIEFTNRPTLVIPAGNACLCVYEDGTQSIPYENA